MMDWGYHTPTQAKSGTPEPKPPPNPLADMPPPLLPGVTWEGKGQRFQMPALGRSHLSHWLTLGAPSPPAPPPPTPTPGELTQKAEEGLELLVRARAERHAAPTLTAPAPQLHLGGNHGESGKVFSVAHFMGVGAGRARWGRMACGESSLGTRPRPPCPPPVEGVEGGQTGGLQKMESRAWRWGWGRRSEQAETGVRVGWGGQKRSRLAAAVAPRPSPPIPPPPRPGQRARMGARGTSGAAER